MGTVHWNKIDIDLQGQNLMDDFAKLQQSLLRVRSKKQLSLDDLDGLLQESVVVSAAIGNLRRRILHVRRGPMIDRVIELLGCPPERREANHAALGMLANEDLKRLFEETEQDATAVKQAVHNWLKPEVREALFGS